MSDEMKETVCGLCGTEIKRETDDMITCGGAFEVWYSELPNGKRTMSCRGKGNLTTHVPKQSVRGLTSTR